MVHPRVFLFFGLIATGLAESEDSGNLTREKKDVGKLQSIAASLTGGYLPSKYTPGYYPGGYSGYSGGGGAGYYGGGGIGGGSGYTDYNYNRWCNCGSQFGPSAVYPTKGITSYFANKYRPQVAYPTQPIGPPPPPPASDDTVVVFPRPSTTYGVPVPQQPSIRQPLKPSLPPPPPPPPQSVSSTFTIGSSFGGFDSSLSSSPGVISGPPPPPPPPPVVTYQKAIGPAPSLITTNLSPSGYSYDRPANPFKF